MDLLALRILAELRRQNVPAFSASALCPDCGGRMGEHRVGGPYHPLPIMMREPPAPRVA